ncbi:V-set and immunoglobulin domain-containing protein 10-like 2 [Rhinophrynus dorsalis]
MCIADNIRYNITKDIIDYIYKTTKNGTATFQLSIQQWHCTYLNKHCTKICYLSRRVTISFIDEVIFDTTVICDATIVAIDEPDGIIGSSSQVTGIQRQFLYEAKERQTSSDIQNNIITEVDGVVGRSVELTCFDAESLYSFMWQYIKLGTDLPIRIARDNFTYSVAESLGKVTLKGNNLVIDNLKLEAYGRYVCEASFDKENSTTLYINLTVLVPVLRPIIQINNSAPVEGSGVLLNCSVKNGTGPIHYIWTRHTVQEGSFLVAEGREGFLHLQSDRSHTGRYTCTVRNKVNEETSGWLYLDVIYGPDEPIITIEPYAISENGYAANEKENVILNCTASSNPPSKYIWLYNNSQVFTGQMYPINQISRSQTGMYTCLAQNIQLDTRTQLTVILTVFYLPEGNPICTALSRNNYKEVALWCSWNGGFPLAQLHWLETSTEDKVIVSYSNATKIKRGADIRNESTYTCNIFHPSLKRNLSCSTTVWIPAGGPNCSAVATKQNEFVMLTCDWPGGLPRIMLEWNNKEIGDSRESSNIYVFKSNTTYNGKLFTCRAFHPMSAETKECQVKLEAPILDTYENKASILEGKDVQLACYLKQANLTSEIIWYDTQNKVIIPDSQKYVIYKENGMSILTIWNAALNESGFYRCFAFNAVGNSSLLVKLQVQGYPTPPNVTISKLIYSRHRTEVDLEWMTQGTGDLTSFMVQRQAGIRSFPGPKRSATTLSWDTVARDIEPDIRGHKLGGLDPGIVYAFRILAVNHRTTGFPSEVKTPADPPFNAYPAVIGAAAAGMIVAAVASLLAFQYIVRNRENNPRLHDLFFRPAPAEARENIRNPEDAETAADIEQESPNMDAPTPSAPPDAPAPETSAAVTEPTAPSDTDVPLSQLSVADLPEDAPVNVTISVTATP